MYSRIDLMISAMIMEFKFIRYYCIFKYVETVESDDVKLLVYSQREISMFAIIIMLLNNV